MSKKYVVYNDVHLYGPHEIDLKREMLDESATAIYLGDNVDMNHVKKKEITAAMLDLSNFRSFYRDRFVPGNHELDLVLGPRSYIDGGICFEHGDYLFWGDEKRARYMKKKKPGAGFFVRFFIIASLDHLRKIWTVSYSQEFKLRAYKRAKDTGCHTIVCGHKHPRKKADFEFLGIRIIVLPRGRNELEI